MNLFFEFTVDKSTNTIHIIREFAADLDLVWDAWTKAEILDLWSAPRPWRAQTKEMDFREGGRWLYSMVSPENVAYWSLVEFLKIEQKSSFTTRNSFCDENGNSLNNVFSLCKNSFRPGDGTTMVIVEKKFDKLSDLEMMISKGFREGLSMSLTNLDEYLSIQVEKHK